MSRALRRVGVVARARWSGWDEERFAAHPEAGATLEDGVEISGVRTDDVTVEGPADEVRFDDVRLAGGGLVGSTLTDLRIADSLLAGVDLAGVRWPGSLWQRVEVRDARLTGADLEAARLFQVRFLRCRIDGVHLADAELVDVRFDDCDLSETFLGRSRLRRVAVVGCDLTRTDLERAEVDGLDLRGSRVDGVARLGGLRGAVVDAAQVTALAPRLADQLGLVVAPDRDEAPDDTWR